MPLFDGYVAVDWSASTEPVDGANSIWIAICDPAGPPRLENPDTRELAMERINALLDEATAMDRRLLCGFDFPFGYPEGTANGLTGRAGWEAVWERIADVITDCPNNANNSFEAAAELNTAFEGEGPFWGLHHTWHVVGILATKAPPGSWGNNLPPNLRYAETVLRNDPNVNPKPQEVWKLFYQGNVGRQALTGIARLETLRRCRDDVRVWPFQTCGEGREQVLDEGRDQVLAEIYPSLIAPCPGNAVLDARQVAATALTLRELDGTALLQQYLQAPNDMPARVITEEGLILGMQDPVTFRAVAARVTPACIIN